MKRLLFILFAIALLVPFSEADLCAQKSRKVRQLESKRKTLNEEINKISALIKDTDKSKSVSLKKLNLLNQQIKARKEVIETLTAEIEEATRETGRMQLELDSLLGEFSVKQSAYVKSLQAMQSRDNAEEQLLFILSAKDFAHGLRRVRYLKDYATWQKQEAVRLRGIHARVKGKQEEIQKQAQEKTALLNERESERANLQKSTEESRQEINKLNKQQKELKAQLNKKRKQAEALNREIEQQIAKEVAAAAERAERAAKAKKSKETTTTASKTKTATAKRQKAPVQYQMNSDEVKLSGNFQNNKGHLPVPITGRYSIVSSFGEHAHESLSYVRVNNNGIDIQGQAGAEARAVFEGVVTRIFVVEGYNNSIIIRHGNYLTVYSNITSVYVKSGDKVTAGQALGKVFADPEMGGATLLHFQIWKERTKLNPQQWIRR
ncbi:murein hydrolase activator EnvC family protein [Porphyromonas cangingivalis]|uniref:Septal ring factor EnvC, activator of murein hydrolases AmiA and AmiB n=1 Tax=Porphyromonas cangingivalis TaxID=36874 RepID=A0A1T4LMD0_PORCN|nr:M23 family metallopeptidase [Porphyromonas cangingivalis]SJZ55614.1 Septal ring factor EnvC, activator of murein hydrolases AmiA and AmiB [Porphyromonas cangingivalis]SPY34534.1 Septal ring factor [Porphyromonas cangingivalis]VEJ02943.1 Septal ring factor [Porphyromonas cangingivalis]